MILLENHQTLGIIWFITRVGSTNIQFFVRFSVINASKRVAVLVRLSERMQIIGFG